MGLFERGHVHDKSDGPKKALPKLPVPLRIEVGGLTPKDSDNLDIRDSSLDLGIPTNGPEIAETASEDPLDSDEIEQALETTQPRNPRSSSGETGPRPPDDASRRANAFVRGSDDHPTPYAQEARKENCGEAAVHEEPGHADALAQTKRLPRVEAGLLNSPDHPSRKANADAQEMGDQTDAAAGLPAPEHQNMLHDSNVAVRGDIHQPDAASGEDPGHLGIRAAEPRRDSVPAAAHPQAAAAEATEQQDPPGLSEAESIGNARVLASRLRAGELDRITVDCVKGLLEMGKSSGPAAVSAAVHTVAWNWWRLANSLPVNDQDGKTLYLEAIRLEEEYRANGEWYRRVRSEALGEQYMRVGAEFQQATGEIGDSGQAVQQLKFAQRTIRDLGASLVADHPYSSSGYANMRREVAVAALRSLDLQRQPVRNSSGGETDIDYDLRTTVQSLLGQLANDRVGDVTEVFGLLGYLDGEISDLLKRQTSTSNPAEWLASAKTILKFVGRFIAAVGAALAVAAGSVLSIEQHPTAADEIQAAAALVIGASCGLLQRDLSVLWHQPNVSRHLVVADSRLRERVASLRAALLAKPTETDFLRSPGAPSSAELIASYAFDVEYAAYAAASLAAATEDWPQVSGYLEEIRHILHTCEQVNKIGAADDIQLASSLADSQGALSQYRIKAELQLLPEAQLGLIGRSREKVMKAGDLRPPINPEPPKSSISI